VKHQATATFWKLYRKLKPEIQALADKNFALLKKDPKHPSLRFRALAIEEKDGFSWVRMGTHDEYDKIIG
jgi:hypothetical protein